VREPEKIFIASISATFFDPRVVVEADPRGTFICRPREDLCDSTKVALVFEDHNGERKSEEFAVKYRCASPTRMKELQDLEESDGRNVAKSLARIVTAIPDITEADGEQPLAINEETLSGLGSDNCQAIYSAIFKDARADAPALRHKPVDSSQEMIVAFGHRPLLFLWVTESEARQSAMRFARENLREEEGFTNHTVVLTEIPRTTFVEAQVFMSLRESLRWLLRLTGFSKT